MALSRAIPILLLTLAGCTTHGPGEPVHLLQGFSLGWELLNHRISLLGVEVVDNEGTPALNLDFIGGTWTTGQDSDDVPLYSALVRTIDCDCVRSMDIEETLMVDTSGFTTFTMRVDDAALGEGERIAVVRGYRVLTDIPQPDPDYPVEYDPADGYTTHGFGVRIDEAVATADGTWISGIAWAQFGSTPDRPSMNMALPYAVNEVKVFLTLMAVEDTSVTDAQASYRVVYPTEGTNTEQPPPPEDLQETSFKGLTKRAEDLAAFSGFRFHLNPEDEHAIYLRSVNLGVDRPTRKGGAGGHFQALGYATHSSVFEIVDLTSDFTGDFVVMSLPRGTTIGEWTSEGQFDVGSTTVDLLPAN